MTKSTFAALLRLLGCPVCHGCTQAAACRDHAVAEGWEWLRHGREADWFCESCARWLDEAERQGVEA